MNNDADSSFSSLRKWRFTNSCCTMAVATHVLDLSAHNNEAVQKTKAVPRGKMEEAYGLQRPSLPQTKIDSNDQFVCKNASLLPLLSKVWNHL